MSTPFKPKNGIAIDNTVTINATSLYIGNSTVNSSFNTNSLNIGSNVSVNTGTLVIGNTTVNSTVSNVRSAVIGANLTIGSNVFITNTSISIGNSSVNTFISNASIATQILTLFGNAVIIGTLTTAGDASFNDVNINSDLTLGEDSTISLGNSTVNATINSTFLAIDGPAAILSALTVGTNVSLNTTALTISSASLRANGITIGSNVNVNTSTLYIGNSTVNATINSTSLDIDGSITGTTISGNGSSLTSLNATQLTTGTVADARLAGAYTGLTSLTIGSNVVVNTSLIKIGNSTVNTVINSSSIDVDGTITATSFSGSLDSSNLTGTIPDARISGAYTGLTNVTSAGTVSANLFSGNGASLTSLNATALSTGTVSSARISGAYTGFTNITGSGTITGALFSGSGASLTSLNASQLTTGTVPNARVAGAYTGITDLSIGSNVVVNTSTLFVASSIVNTVINSSGITTKDATFAGNVAIDGTLTVNGGATFITVANSQTISDGNATVNATMAVVVTNGDGKIELGGSNSASIDLKVPFADDYDLRLFVNSVAATINTGLPLTLNSSNASGIGFVGNVSFDGGTLFVDSVSNRIGIACTTPVVNASIDVAGAIRTTSGLESGSGGWVGFNTYYNGTAMVSRTGANGSMLFSTNNGLLFTFTQGTGVAGANVSFNNILMANSSVFNVNASMTTLSGALSVGGILSGNGSLLTSLNATQLTTGTIPSARVSGAYTGFTNITASGTITGGTFSGNGVTLTYLNASQLGTGTVPDARITGAYTGLTSLSLGSNVVLNSDYLSIGSSTVNTVINSTAIVADGTITANLFSGNGASITSVNSTALTGTIPDARISGSYTGLTNITASGTITAGAFSGSGASITGMSATQLTTGTLPDARLTGSYTGLTSLSLGSNVVLDTAKLSIGTALVNTVITSSTIDVDGTVTATLFSGSGASLTSLNATQLTTGTIPSARISGAYTGFTNITGSGTITGALFSGSGASLTSLNATALGSGTVPDARITGAYTGLTSLSLGSNVVLDTAKLSIGTSTVNTVITSSTIDVDGTVTATLFSGSGASLTSIPATSLTGTIADARISGSYTGLTNITASGTITGGTFSGSGASLTLIPAGQLTGTVADGRISGSYTGFTNITASGTVTASGFSGSGASLTSIPAGQLTGTIADGRITGSYTGLTNLSIGANVVLNTQALRIGNSTVNTVISSTTITTDGTVTANLFSGNGASIVNINASALGSGTIPDARLTGAYTGLTSLKVGTSPNTYIDAGSINTASVVATYGFFGSGLQLNGDDTGSISANNGYYARGLYVYTSDFSNYALTVNASQVGIQSRIFVANNDGTVSIINRDSYVSGTALLTSYRINGTEQGRVFSSDGTTIQYQTFTGGHISQSNDDEILIGTVMETIDELCEWDDTTNDYLAKTKVSDTVESQSVYGVFSGYDDDGDVNIASLGTYKIRVHKDVEVCRGDLLVSNGDGTAKKQKDKTIRSATIGKVTAAIKVKEYDDGSYLVPCVLYCG